VTSIAILAIYLAVMWWMFRREQNCQALSGDTGATYGHLSTRTVCLRFCLWAAVVIAAGIWLSYVGAELGETTGWNSTFVESLFLAVTTSAPELVVTVACLRLGAVDMAVADILGSNMFNIAIVAPVDLFYREGPLLSMASPNNLITAGVVIVMNIVVIAALKLPQKRKALGFVTWYVPLLIALYVFAAYAVFHSGWGP